MGPSEDNGFGDLFSVRFVATVVLDFDMQIEATLGAVEFLTLKIWAFEFSFDVVSAPTVMFLSARGVALALELF